MPLVHIHRFTFPYTVCNLPLYQPVEKVSDLIEIPVQQPEVL